MTAAAQPPRTMTRLTDEQIIAMLGTSAEEGPLTGTDPPMRCWDVTEKAAVAFARAIEAAVLAANPQVPYEATDAMIEAGWIVGGPAPDIVPRKHYLGAIWRAMYDAAPNLDEDRRAITAARGTLHQAAAIRELQAEPDRWQVSESFIWRP